MKTIYYYSLEQTRRQNSGPGPIHKVNLDFLTRKCAFYGIFNGVQKKGLDYTCSGCKRVKLIAADLFDQYLPSVEKHGKATTLVVG